jgi:hypothetical protein
MLFDPGLSHPTAMFRRAILEAKHLRYDPAYPHAEDYALWIRIAAATEVANLPDVLLRYRIHGDSVSHTHRGKQLESAARVRREQIQSLGITPTERQIGIHTTLMRGAPHTLELDIDEAEAWLIALLEANRRTGYCPQETLSAMLYETWFKLCRAHRTKIGSVARRFLRSPVASGVAWPGRLLDGARLFALARG